MDDDIETKLKGLVARVESSSLLDSDKDRLYVTISDALKASVLPVLLQHLSKSEMKDMAKNPAGITLDRYISMVTGALGSDGVPDEAASSMDAVVGQIDAALKESNI